MPAKNPVALALLPLLCAAPLLAQTARPSTEIRLGGLTHQLAPGYSPASIVDGCTVVRAAADRMEEDRRDCSAPRPSVRGRVFEWLEAPGGISLYPATLAAGGLEPPPLLLGASANVRVAAADPAATVDFFQLDSFRASRYPQPDFRRRASAAEAERGVALPAGLVMAAVRGSAGTVLARPQRVAPGASAALAPAPPAADRADLLLILSRTRPFRYYDRDHEVAPWLRRGAGEPRRPDLLVGSGDRVLAIFYDLPAGSWRLGADSAAYSLSERGLELRSGEARVASFDLAPLPHLAALLEMPAGLRNGPLIVEAFDLASGERLTEIAGIDPRSERVDLGYLAPAEVEVRLTAETWLFKQVADLRPQQDAELRFAPQPIAVSGLVTRAGNPFETWVLFSPGGPDKPESTRTDPGGRYETVVYRSGFFPVIFDMGETRPAFVREVIVPEAPSATFDFDLPGNDVRVVVVDAESQEAVPSPTIYAELIGADRPAGGEAPLGETMKMQFAAGSEGVLELPPLAARQVVLSASAEGYLRSPPQVYDVPQLGQQHELRVLLEKSRQPRRLAFSGPDGLPAAGLEVRAQDGLQGSAPAFEGFTDAQGELAVPEQVDGLFLLWRDPSGRLASGFTVLRADDPRLESPLALGAGNLLVARVIDRGGAAVDAAPFLMWSGGERIEGETLEFLYGAQRSDAFGYFRARGLAGAPLALLAHGPGRKFTELDGTPIAWPWPAIVQLEKVE